MYKWKFVNPAKEGLKLIINPKMASELHLSLLMGGFWYVDEYVKKKMAKNHVKHKKYITN